MALRFLRSTDVPKRQISLKQTLIRIAEELNVSDFSVYLFGSRRHASGSIRSDVDLLVRAGRRLTTPDAETIWDIEPYLDCFQVIGDTADSLINESRLKAGSLEGLIELLDAVPLFIDGDWQTDADEYDTQIVLSDRSPAATIVPLYDLYDAVPAERADILVISALTEEYSAVLKAALEAGGVLRHGRTSLTNTTQVELDGWRITIRNLDEMGSVGAALKTRDAILRTKAIHIVLVGICAGIPGKVRLGSVVIPKSILYFESAKISEYREERADDQRHCDDDVRAGVTSLIESAVNELPAIHSGGGILACGEKVVASKKFRNNIRKRHRKIIAIDMESYGVARAADEVGRKVTVIKGVCDMADSRKNDKWHQRAAAAAALTFIELVRSGGFRTRESRIAEPIESTK